MATAKRVRRGNCHCGCGRKVTELATRTNRRWGYVKGEPRPYIRGHGHKIKRKLPGEKIRVTRRQRSAYMNRDQLFAAYTLYDKGQFTIREVADLIWEKFGYINRESCERQLARSWASYGLKTHSGMKARANRLFCSGCGCAMNERTPKCKTCNQRHWNRIKREAVAG